MVAAAEAVADADDAAAAESVVLVFLDDELSSFAAAAFSLVRLPSAIADDVFPLQPISQVFRVADLPTSGVKTPEPLRLFGTAKAVPCRKRCMGWPPATDVSVPLSPSELANAGAADMSAIATKPTKSLLIHSSLRMFPRLCQRLNSENW
ncbi:MAG: hypothetical protein ACYC92_13080 [Candidatus Acidiferrales bacterium]